MYKKQGRRGGPGNETKLTIIQKLHVTLGIGPLATCTDTSTISNATFLTFAGPVCDIDYCIQLPVCFSLDVHILCAVVSFGRH